MYDVQYLTNYVWEYWTRDEDLGVAMTEARNSSSTYQCKFRVIDRDGSELYRRTPDGCDSDHSVGGKYRWQEVGF